jgi:RecA/RadA recombinase
MFETQDRALQESEMNNMEIDRQQQKMSQTQRVDLGSANTSLLGH